MDKTFVVKGIGKVEAGQDGFRLQIDDDYIAALQGLEGYGVIQVFWWANQLDSDEQRAVLTCDQPYVGAPEKMGVFATRSPVRPNPICLTPVHVLNINYETGTIKIPYIDAEDGTPILDIKPYHPSVDRVRDVPVPAWCSTWPQCLEDSATFDWGSVFLFSEE